MDIPYLLISGVKKSINGHLFGVNFYTSIGLVSSVVIFKSPIVFWLFLYDLKFLKGLC